MDGLAGIASSPSRFVGRTRERAALRHLLHEAIGGRFAIVVVAGVPGAGKTAFLEWTAAAAAGAGADVLWASGYESSLPFAALRRLTEPFRELGEALRGVAGNEADGPDLARVVVETFATRAGRRPLVAVVDDIQDLGDASRGVLADALVGLDDRGARTSVPVLLVLSARTPVDPHGLAGRALRLRSARRITLGGFDEAELADYIAVASGRRPDRARIDALLDVTGGLPLLVEAAVERMQAAADGRGAIDVPDRVRTITDAVRDRFEHVDQPTLMLLRRAAVLGDPWDVDELAAVTDHSRDEIRMLMDAAERARLVARAGPATRFAHPLVRTELLDGLSSVERAGEHASIAARLTDHAAASGAADDDVDIRIADHLLRSGRRTPDVADAARRAGRIAFRWTAYGQAARFLAAAAELADPSTPPDEVAARLFEAGHAAYYDYDHERAEALFAASIAVAADAGSDTLRLRAATQLTRMRGGNRRRPLDDVDVRELRAALDASVDVDAGEVVQAQAALVEALVNAGRVEDATPVIAAARRTARTLPADRLVDDALGTLDFAAGIQPMTLLELHAAEGMFADAVTHGTAANSALTQTLALSRLGLMALLRGRIHHGSTTLGDVDRRTAAHRFWGEAGLAAAFLAYADVLSGRPSATDRVEQAYGHWKRTNNPWTGAILSALVPALVGRGAAPMARAHDPGSVWSADRDLPTASIHVVLGAVEACDAAAARRVLATASWSTGVRGPVTMNTLSVPAALVEAGDLVGDAVMVGRGRAALTALATRGVRTTLPWPATVDRLLATVARNAGDLDEGRRWAQAALQLCEREALLPERAKVLLELARIEAAVGAADDAATAMAMAVDAFDALSMPGWLARCDAIGRDVHVPPAVGSSGQVRERTILTNDIVGSTASNARLGDVLYVEQLRVHDRILRSRVRQFHGVEIKHTGDGLNVAFNDRRDAVRCALAAQRDFERWRRDEPDVALRIRCGLAHGSLVPSGGDFFGLVQSEAARVCALAAGGDVLSTASVVADCPPEVHAVALGPVDLAGLPGLTEVFRLVEVG